MIDDNNIEKLFQEGLGGMSEMPPASVKSNIDKAIGFKSGAGIWIYSVVAVLIVLIGLFVYKCTSQESPIYQSAELKSIGNDLSAENTNVISESDFQNESVSSIDKSDGFASTGTDSSMDSEQNLSNNSSSLRMKSDQTTSTNTSDSSSDTQQKNNYSQSDKDNLVNNRPDEPNDSLDENNSSDTNDEFNAANANETNNQNDNSGKNDDKLMANNSDNNGILNGEPLFSNDSLDITDNNDSLYVDSIPELADLAKSDSIITDSLKEAENVLVPNLPDPLKRLKYIGLSTGPIFPNSTDNVDSRTGFAAELYYQQSVFGKFYASGGIGYAQNSSLIQKVLSDTTYIDTSYIVYTFDSNQQVMDSMVVTDSSQVITTSDMEELAKTQQFTIPINIGWMHNLNNKWAVLVNLGARPTFNSYRNNGAKSDLGLNKFSMDITLQPSIVYKLNRFEFLAGPGFGYSAISKWKEESQFYKPREIFWNVRAGIRFRL